MPSNPLVKEIITEMFMEVAPVIVAQPILHDWLDRHGFHVTQYGGEWRVVESSVGNVGLYWHEPFLDYATMLTAVLDEIIEREKQGVPQE